jgi:hypothetical protein
MRDDDFLREGNLQERETVELLRMLSPCPGGQDCPPGIAQMGNPMEAVRLSQQA